MSQTNKKQMQCCLERGRRAGWTSGFHSNYLLQALLRAYFPRTRMLIGPYVSFIWAVKNKDITAAVKGATSLEQSFSLRLGRNNFDGKFNGFKVGNVYD